MKRDFKQLSSLVGRNINLYFKDKLTFFLSLLTPIILVVLFLTFLKGIYESSINAMIPDGLGISNNLVNAFTGGWLFSSIMATSCISVSFCSNMMVNDKLSKSITDFKIAPVKGNIIQTSYVISNFITTFIVCFVLFLISLIYLGIVGFYLSFADILLILVDMILSILFGTLIANIIGIFINSQGGLSATSSLVSSMYGFICGAYMPLSQFGEGMRNFVAFNPGTYGTVLFRQSYMNGILKEINKIFVNNNIPNAGEIVEEIRLSFDGSFKFFGTNVSSLAMFLILIVSITVLFALYLLLVYLKNKGIIKFNIKNKAKAK